MKYFVVADIHGFYSEFQKALIDAGFDKTNPEHMLISLGDAIDRGSEPLQTLEYLNELHKDGKAILIRGNHEDLFERMYFPTYADIQNGTYDTARVLSGGDYLLSYADITKSKQNPHWRYYFDHTLDYFETEHYIFVHGWIPYTPEGEDWRKSSDAYWSDARWRLGSHCYANGEIVAGKTIVCGHEFSCLWHSSFNKEPKYSNHTPFYGEGVIACDPCICLSHKINVVVLED